MSKRRRIARASTDGDDDSDITAGGDGSLDIGNSNGGSTNRSRSIPTRITLDEFEELENIEDPGYLDNNASDGDFVDEEDRRGDADLSFGPPGGLGATEAVAENDFVQLIIKNAFARSINDKVTNRKHLREGWKNSKSNFGEAFKKANLLLDKYFGLKLEEQVDTTKKSETAYSLITSMERKEREILDKLWMNVHDVHSNNKRSEMEQYYFIARNKRDKLPGDNGYLVKMGITSIILSVIVIEGNNANKKKLLKVLSKFGIDVSPETKNSNIEHSIPSLLKELEDTRYIKKASDSPQQQTNDAHIFYNLGKKALIEFSPICFFYFIQEIYGSDFGDDVKEKTVATLKTAFKSTFNDDLPTQDQRQAEGEDDEEGEE